MSPNILSIAGSDPSGGAGIQSDLKVFAALGCYGMAAITTLTVQNTQGVQAVYPVDPALIKAQIHAVFEDISVGAVKIGMIAEPQAVHAIADILEEFRPPVIVLDPVMAASRGAFSMDGETLEALKERLIPLADVVTPNIPECEKLTRKAVLDMEDAARDCLSLGPCALLLKGGHAKGTDSVDVLATAQGVKSYALPRVEAGDVHGTGCALSSALACYLARGMALEEAAAVAKAYVHEALAQAEKSGFLNHLREAQG